jgi:hypothetical protein
MKIEMTSGNLLLVFIHSLFMLLFGCAIGMHWHGSPTTALCLTILGAALWAFHELITVLLWFSVTAASTRMAAKTTDSTGGTTARRVGRNHSE